MNYNTGKVVDSSKIGDKDQALHDFAEGSVALENVLRELWNLGINTRACCKGHNEKRYYLGYIATERSHSKLFEYLSPELLKDKNIILEQSNADVIRFYSRHPEEREELLNKILNSIKNGPYQLSETRIKLKMVQSRIRLEQLYYRNSLLDAVDDFKRSL